MNTTSHFSLIPTRSQGTVCLRPTYRESPPLHLPLPCLSTDPAYHIHIATDSPPCATTPLDRHHCRPVRHFFRLTCFVSLFLHTYPDDSCESASPETDRSTTSRSCHPPSHSNPRRSPHAAPARLQTRRDRHSVPFSHSLTSHSHAPPPSPRTPSHSPSPSRRESRRRTRETR